MKRNLSVKGANFVDGNELMLNVNGRPGAGVTSGSGGRLGDAGGFTSSLDNFTIKSSSPSPSVASLINSAQQNETNFSPYGEGSGKSHKNAANAGTAAVVAAMAANSSKGGRFNDAGVGGKSHQFASGGDKIGESKKSSEVLGKYWTSPVESSNNAEDLVVIHVCDENRQISKDFCCKRDILVKHMKYFEKFLQENESGYDDIDISVHCDVEIFEWLMTYIHEPEKPPNLEKAIVVSILISSEFLQMDMLVEHCLVHIASTLNETIRLPIDLSCISDKIVNRLAALTHPKTLANTKDRKDKILNKLYKRRVELDFSRKSGARGGVRTIAASLTCCRYCGMVYLDNWVSYLFCKSSPLAIDFRGKLTKRHSAIAGWSLTSYLKSLHVAGMNWDSIYWHVWASCQVFKVSDFMVSIIEIDRYAIESDGLLIHSPDVSRTFSAESTATSSSGSNDNELGNIEGNEMNSPSLFTLNAEDDKESGSILPSFKLKVSNFDNKPSHPQITYTLNPNRPPEMLPVQVYELICTQTKFISSELNLNLITKTAKQMILTVNDANEAKPFNFQHALWADDDVGLFANGMEERARGRSRSPTNRKGKEGVFMVSKSQTRGTNARETKNGRDKLKVANSNANREPSVDSNDGSGGSGSDTDSQKDESKGTNMESKTSGGGFERRSRSMGAVSSSNSRSNTKSNKDNKKQNSNSRREGPGIRRVVHSPGEENYKYTLYNNPTVGRNIAMFRTVPPEVIRRIHMTKGSVRGIWLQPHPLQLHPIVFADSVNSAKDSTLPAAKKFEWEMDLLREYDDHKQDKYEDFLIERRNAAESLARSASTTHAISMFKSHISISSKSNNNKDIYYRDRGRKPR